MPLWIWSRFVVIGLSVLVISSHADLRIHGEAFHDALTEKIVDPVLGTQILQDVFNEATFTELEINGTNIISMLSSKLGTNFAQAFDAVTTLQKAAEDHFGSWTRNAGISPCCDQDASKLEYDYSFKNHINDDTACSRVSGEALQNASVPFEPKLLEAFKVNRANAPLVKWQYVGTEHGVLAQFPVQHAALCDHYDNRFRPWYVEAATPQPKDIVLVIDRSESMAKNGAMESARQAATTLITTLNPNDRIGVVAFSSDVQTPSTKSAECLAHQLAFATSSVKKLLIAFVENISPEGSTKYLLAFDKAFDLLNMSTSDISDKRKRHSAIVFLTDGEPTDHEASSNFNAIYNRISYRNGGLKNKVVILTYGFGEAITDSEENLLKNISAQRVFDPLHDPPKPGRFTKVNSKEELRVQLGSYYTFFRSFSSHTTPIITVPYFDYFGLGLVTSVCLPIHSNDTILGVTCVDVRVADILGDTAFFEAGNFAYAFVIDGTGRVMIHPNLPNLYSIDHSPSYLNIRDLETEVAMKPVIASMKSGHSGSTLLDKKNFILTRGTTKREGITRQGRPAQAHWSPVNLTDLSVCLVYASSDRAVSVQTTEWPKCYYHRLDLVHTEDTCNHNSRLGLVDASVVKFSGEAFKAAYRYYDEKETPTNAEGYEIYMEGNWLVPAAKLFKPGVRDMVALTAKLDSFWVARPHTFAISTYAATVNGVIRVYPGIALDKLYDPKDRSWFKRSIANKGKYTFAVPYIDAFGFGLITTLSQTVYSGSSSGTHSPDDMISAVVGLDMRLEYLGYILNTTFPACNQIDKRCFLVDTSGYLIYDHDFKNEDQIYKLDHLHIMEKDPDIANKLIELGHLKSETCTDFYNKEQYKTWRLDIVEGFVEHFDMFPYFDIHIIQNSNIYVGIRKHRPTPVKTCRCPPRSHDTRTFFLECQAETGCECPCYSEAEFNDCVNTFSSDAQYACKQEAQTSNFTSPIANETELAKGKPVCIEYNCSVTDQGSCVSLLGCTWCEKPGVDPICLKPDQCLPIVTTTTERPVFTSSPPPVTIIVGSALGGVVGLIIAVVIIVIACRRYRRPNPGQCTIMIPDRQSNMDGHTNPSGLDDHYNSIEDVYLNQLPPDILAAKSAGRSFGGQQK